MQSSKNIGCEKFFSSRDFLPLFVSARGQYESEQFSISCRCVNVFSFYNISTPSDPRYSHSNMPGRWPAKFSCLFFPVSINFSRTSFNNIYLTNTIYFFKISCIIFLFVHFPWRYKSFTGTFHFSINFHRWDQITVTTSISSCI